MRCKDVRTKVLESWSEEVPASLREHLAACSACEAYARDLGLVRRGFQALASEVPPEPSWGFAARLVRRLEELEEKSRGADFLEKVGRRVVYAAGLLTLLLFLALVLPASGPLRGPTTGELYWAQSDTAALTNVAIFPGEAVEGRELNLLAPEAGGTEGKR